LTVARLDENKRLDTLIHAFSIFLAKYPSSILLIGGTGPESENLDNLINNLRINQNVKLLGFIPDEKIYDYYAWADLFVSIDWADFRITSYEAMAMGTKVLLSNETDVENRLLDTGYYYLTIPDVDNVVKMIENALFNHNEISKSELLTILRKYTWSEYFSKMERIINV
jgi:glycosyltransferase involved in cell wall biosynthesis